MASTEKKSILDLPLTPFDELLNKVRPLLKAPNVLVHKEKILNEMSNYDSRSEDWCHYAHFEESTYTKNLIEDGGDYYNMMTMCWRPGQTSPIHGHEGAHCFIKMLCGSLTEEHHNFPDGSESGGDAKQGFNRRILGTNMVHYIDDTIGVHRMTNCDQRDAISLHIYAPPYRECRIFALEWPRTNPTVDYSLSSDRHRHHQTFSIVRNLMSSDENCEMQPETLKPISSKVVQVTFHTNNLLIRLN